MNAPIYVMQSRLNRPARVSIKNGETAQTVRCPYPSVHLVAGWNVLDETTAVSQTMPVDGADRANQGLAATEAFDSEFPRRTGIARSDTADQGPLKDLSLVMPPGLRNANT